MCRYDIGFEEARQTVLSVLSELPSVSIPLSRALGHVIAVDTYGRTDSPSVSVSLKDGFAVFSGDLENATLRAPVALKLSGVSTAGLSRAEPLPRGSAMKVNTGAPVPNGADAVLSSEFAGEQGDTIWARKDAGSGRNILEKGADVRCGEKVAQKDELLTPARLGLLAAAGLDRVLVIPKARVAVLATGDELVSPGDPIQPGQVFASNLVTLTAWLQCFGMVSEGRIVSDREADIEDAVLSLLSSADVLLTSGGAFGSERDLTIRTLDRMGWKREFRRIRMGPGKGTTFGILDEKPVFCLPGGPPSNELSFLTLVLPGLLKMCGRRPIPFPHVRAKLLETVRGDPTWTQFLYARFMKGDTRWTVFPIRLKSRLQSQALADALIRIPEGTETLHNDDVIEVEALHSEMELHP